MYEAIQCPFFINIFSANPIAHYVCNTGFNMLTRLFIQNYAIIDEVEIDFSASLNIITGETGAGKSILIGALGLILGQRADASILLFSEKKCLVEGTFSIDHNLQAINFLKEHDFDTENELVIRREIATSGKSRAFINDTPATLVQIRALASMLVNLHQQFDTLELGNDEFQRQIIDALANNEQPLIQYQQTYKEWQATKAQLKDLLARKSDFQKEAEYQQFLFDELKEISFKENELEDIEHELKLLTNTESIKAALAGTYYQIKESETPVTALLKQLANTLKTFEDYHSAIKPIAERIQSVYIELNDIAAEANHLDDALLHDASRIETINERLAVGYKLLKKHGVQTTAELLAIQEQISQRLLEVLNIDDTILQLQQKEKEQHNSIKAQSKIISDNRKKESIPFCQKVNELLTQVGMPNAQIKVDLTDCEPNRFGADEITFLFDANKTNKFELLSKVASGGELSRLMLCIKSLVAKAVKLPTMIFDEIDTGISGEAAKQVGLIMKSLSANIQIVSITHQPQIAAKAVKHFFVYKEDKSGVIKTRIRVMQKEERIHSIAQMLSGENPTATALATAKEMIEG